MKRQFVLAALVMLTGSLTGCASLSCVERAEYATMKADGTLIEEKKPALAAALGVLPGGGSFYTRQWGLGVADLLLWPISIAWDPFAGYYGSEVINYAVTRSHFHHRKAKEVAELDRQLAASEITAADYFTRKQQIEGKYGGD